MRSMWTKGLALALGLIASGARGQAPGVTIGRPVAALGLPVATAGPAASLSRPVPLAPKADGIEQASFVQGGLLAPRVRGAMADPAPGRPASGLHGWRRSDEASSAFVVPPGSPVASAGPVMGGVPGPVMGGMSGPVMGGVPGPVLGGVPGPVASGGPAYAVSPGGAVVGLPPADDCGACASGACGGYAGTVAGVVDGAMPGGRTYITLDYLGWWVKGDQTPPLIAAQGAGGGPNTGILPPVGSAAVLYGNSALGEDMRSGLRLFAGHWFSDDRALGLEVGGFYLGEQQNRYVAASGGNPVIRRPIINQTPGTRLFGQEDGELVAGGGLLAGSTDVLHRSSLWGYEVNLKRGLLGFCGESYTLDGLVGFRSLGLVESLAMGENLTVLQAGPVTNFMIRDKFSTTNRFYGGQVGLQGELWLLERLSLGMTGKVALGVNQSQTRIEGSTTFFNGGTNLGAGAGGLYALPSNIGSYNRNRFSIVPEVGLTLNYQLTDWMRVSAGYSFLYWTNVQRPGEQIDRNVNFNGQPVFNGTSVVPGSGTGPAVPRFLDRTSDFWAQGFNLGLEFRF